MPKNKGGGGGAKGGKGKGGGGGEGAEGGKKEKGGGCNSVKVHEPDDRPIGGTVGYSIFIRDVVSGQILLALSLTRKTKKDHQNRTIINEITAIFGLIKVLFLWTII